MNHSLLYRWNMFKARLVWPYWAWRKWLAQYQRPCGYECAWAYPYGFVPEDGCPVHDQPSLWLPILEFLE